MYNREKILKAKFGLVLSITNTIQIMNKNSIQIKKMAKSQIFFYSLVKQCILVKFVCRLLSESVSSISRTLCVTHYIYLVIRLIIALSLTVTITCENRPTQLKRWRNDKMKKTKLSFLQKNFFFGPVQYFLNVTKLTT